jgi:hypothetical protein
MITLMEESRFLLINVAVVILLLILFIRGNRRRAPSNLRFGGPAKLPPKAEGKGKAPERNLNCLFQYNGHTWDAHEILGVPAGAPAEIIRAGYETSLKNCGDEESKAFTQAAFEALRQSGQA